MAKGDKEFNWRREGMIYAYNLAKEKGIEALDQEMKMRGLWKIDITVPTKRVEYIYDYFSRNLSETIISTVMYSAREYAGWGKKKLQEFYQCINKNCGDLIDLNWHGEHYVTFVDIAKEMNEQFGFQFDLERLGMLDEIDNKTNAQVRKLDLEETCDFLEREGYSEAAACLKKKVEWLRS